uniref:ORF171 n=1 Tax=Cyanidiococcus yangmingshanensis TaxID=2690220 RepID=A0A7G5VUS6_9RHOD|nr:ORF171 [Cyanidiococcus yangmingshanensis]QMX77443.1 ORF171 [Cyanidiococcus yangmingshanensis]UNJ15861.1 hypothetical protein [Cyanidioschyzonaceae sp. 2]UNJ16057.1 hypothetical protein [Cyanidioschyzonaceae sp. 3]WDB00450.1 hypothetical protein CCYA8123_138 [Cyanidiococcus yangmingshanensis]
MDLSWSTWLIHHCSVIEWMIIISMIPKRYQTAMHLNLISAWAAISWHLTHNHIEWLVLIQAATTGLANYQWYEHSKRTNSRLKKME